MYVMQSQKDIDRGAVVAEKTFYTGNFSDFPVKQLSLLKMSYTTQRQQLSETFKDSFETHFNFWQHYHFLSEDVKIWVSERLPDVLELYQANPSECWQRELEIHILSLTIF